MILKAILCVQHSCSFGAMLFIVRELSFFTSGGVEVESGGGKWGDHMKIFPSKGGIIRKFF